MEQTNYDVVIESHYIEIVKENNIFTLLAAMLNYGNELGLEGRKIYGVHFNEDDKIEVRTKKMGSCDDDPESS